MAERVNGDARATTQKGRSWLGIVFVFFTPMNLSASSFKFDICKRSNNTLYQTAKPH